MKQLITILLIWPIILFGLGSHDARASVSFAPKISSQQGQQHVVVPAVRMDDEKAGEVVLGKTTLADILAMLPGDRPKKSRSSMRASWLPSEIVKVLERIERTYNPPTSIIIMGFDRNDILIFLQTHIPEEHAKNFSRDLNNLIDMNLIDMNELHRKSDRIVRQAKLTPCVIMHTTAPLEKSGEVRAIGAVYFYTCGD